MIFLSSCDNSNTKEKISFNKKSQVEKNKVDSLQNIIDTLKTKYIFDKMLVLNIVNKNKPLIAGEEYTGKFYFVAYNEDDRVLFSQKAIPKKMDTLSKIDIGGYIYNFIAKKGENKFYFQPLVKDTFAKQFENSKISGMNILGSRVAE